MDAKYNRRYNFVELLPGLRRHIGWIKRYVDGKVRVLDVGCGFGYFLKLCDELHWETHGVDISSFAINTARKNTKAELHLHDIQDVEKSPFDSDYFDLITMFEVLEHLSFPVTTLTEARRILKHTGKLVITTPNLNAIERILMKMSSKENLWHGFNDETHLNWFTPFSLKALMKQMGFRILELKTPFHPMAIIANRILEKTELGGQIWLVAEKI